MELERYRAYFSKIEKDTVSLYHVAAANAYIGNTSVVHIRVALQNKQFYRRYIYGVYNVWKIFC